PVHRPAAGVPVRLQSRREPFPPAEPHGGPPTISPLATTGSPLEGTPAPPLLPPPASGPTTARYCHRAPQRGAAPPPSPTPPACAAAPTSSPPGATKAAEPGSACPPASGAGRRPVPAPWRNARPGSSPSP